MYKYVNKQVYIYVLYTHIGFCLSLSISLSLSPYLSIYLSISFFIETRLEAREPPESPGAGSPEARGGGSQRQEKPFPRSQVGSEGFRVLGF